MELSGGEALGEKDYEAFLNEGEPDFAWQLPDSEWDAIALNYTSGTTGNPKGVVYHHRGAYLNAASNIISWGMAPHSVYLWTLPMFHCNGWCFPWTLAANAGTSICLRKVDPALIFGLIKEHKVSHMCGAPIVYGMMINAPAALKEGIEHQVNGLIAGAAPPAAGSDEQQPLLSFSGNTTLPHAWQAAPARAGLLDSEAASWAHGRLAASPGAELRLGGLRARLCLSPGLRILSLPLTINEATGYELRQLGGLTALDSLRRNLPPELRADLPLHQIAIARAPQAAEPGAQVPRQAPAVSILSANGDGSLTLAEPLPVGEHVHWALRQPLSAEQDMRQSLAVDGEIRPDFALMFSCLGRGPLFYGSEDRDLLAFRERFPGVPLIGAYGSGQIAPVDGGNRLFQNTVVTLLYESAHV